jgi:hypothetical protein
MAIACTNPGCKSPVPPDLEGISQCVLHFTQQLERTCWDLRLEIARGTSSAARNTELADFVADQGELLARVGTRTPQLSDDLKSRILATFLTLMNLHEHVERAAGRRASISIPSP